MLTENVFVSAVFGALSALEALCDYALYKSTFYLLTYLLTYITPPSIGERSIVISVSVCVCPRSYLRNCTSDLQQFFMPVTYGSGSLLFWRRSDMLCTSGFMCNVIFAHKPRLLDDAAQLKRSAHAALGLAINCAQ